jgi:hypothetical protein
MKTYTGKKTKLSYIPPFIELTEIVVEKGFAGSPSTKTGDVIWDGGVESITGYDES